MQAQTITPLCGRCTQLHRERHSRTSATPSLLSSTTQSRRKVPMTLLLHITQLFAGTCQDSRQWKILRTYRLSQDSLAADSGVRWKNYLFKIERVLVDVADSSDNEVRVRAYGFHMQATSADQQTVQKPSAACVQCRFDSDASIFVNAECEPCSSDESNALDDHTRVCLQTEASEHCSESIWFPTSRPPTAAGLMMILLLFLQKQNLASAIYLFGLGTRLSGQGLKYMR